MKRKLISFDAFKKIEEASLTNAQEELIGAEEVLAKTLGVDNLKLFTFGESDVTYQAPDGSFVHATYEINNEKLVLENIEPLVIEQEVPSLLGHKNKVYWDVFFKNYESEKNKYMFY